MTGPGSSAERTRNRGLASERPSGRDTILARVRAANGEAKRDAAAEWASVPRDYLQGPTLSPAETLALLEDRLLDYDAEVVRASEADVSAVLGKILKAGQGERPTLLPEGFPLAWLPAAVAFTVDRGLTARELDRFDTVLTTATAAIADTGTLVLQGVPGQGRRATTLVPDTHVCVVRAADVVQSVPEAFRRLQPTATLPTTFVSGPSATADIEMTRIKGVHGPRFLHVVLVMPQDAASLTDQLFPKDEPHP